MKVLPFRIPKTEESSLHLQIDDEVYFYDKLHQHPEAQLTWIIEGEGTLIHGDYLGSFKSGEVYLMGSNVPHVFRSDKRYYQENDRVLSQSIFFRLDQLREAAKVFPELKSLLKDLAEGDRGLKVKDASASRILSYFKLVFEEEGVKRLAAFFDLLAALAS
ncbi:MAG: hypothetical protein ACJASP_001767, partial [Roseivirga sp.]